MLLGAHIHNSWHRHDVIGFIRAEVPVNETDSSYKRLMCVCVCAYVNVIQHTANNTHTHPCDRSQIFCHTSAHAERSALGLMQIFDTKAARLVDFRIVPWKEKRVIDKGAMKSCLSAFNRMLVTVTLYASWTNECCAIIPI